MRRRGRVRAVSQPLAEGVWLGRRRSGERLFGGAGAEVVMPFGALPRHMLIVGTTGSGKTESAMRVAYEVATKRDAPVFVLDAKGDWSSAERFVGVMREAGRNPRVFPNERFDAWRGDAMALANRLVEVVRFADVGAAAYYRDIAKVAVRLACEFRSGPPRSSEELMARLEYSALEQEHGGTSGALLTLKPELVAQVRMRYEAFFGLLGSRLDGEWSWEDADSAYVMLDGLAMGEEAQSAARLLFMDFVHYFTQRKERDAEVLMVIDEINAIAEATDVATAVEQARVFKAGLVLIPQTLSGLGSQDQRDAVMGNVGTVIAHAMPEPAEVSTLAGRRRGIEVSRRFEAGAFTEEGTSREVERPNVSEEDVRELPQGTAWVMSRGKAAMVAMRMAPQVSAQLPEEEPWRRTRRPKREVPPEHLTALYGEEE